MYSHCFYKYLLKNKIIYPKQFGVEVYYSTDHAIIQLANQIYGAFENNLYTIHWVCLLIFQKPLIQ